MNKTIELRFYKVYKTALFRYGVLKFRMDI